MKKKLLVGVLTITMFAAIVGCGSSKTTEVPAEKTTTEAVKAEEVTTEAPAPEVATTEAEPQMATEKVEVLMDPKTYEWRDDEKIVYNDGNTVQEFYWDVDPAYGDDYTVVIANPDKHQKVSGASLVEMINTYLKFIYECSDITFNFTDDNAVIGYYDEETVDEVEPWDENVTIVYTTETKKYTFYAIGTGKESIGHLKKEDTNGHVYWDYPLSAKMRENVAEFIKVNEDINKNIFEQ